VRAESGARPSRFPPAHPALRTTASPKSSPGSQRRWSSYSLASAVPGRRRCLLPVIARTEARTLEGWVSLWDARFGPLRGRHSADLRSQSNRLGTILCGVRTGPPHLRLPALVTGVRVADQRRPRVDQPVAQTQGSAKTQWRGMTYAATLPAANAGMVAQPWPSTSISTPTTPTRHYVDQRQYSPAVVEAEAALGDGSPRPLGSGAVVAGVVRLCHHEQDAA
jgi:hypothetical protein